LGALKGNRTTGGRVTFAEWIEQTGVDALARKLRVTQATIRNWRDGICDPKVDQMRAIKRWTKGTVSYDLMIDRPRFTHRANPRPKRRAFLVVPR